MIMALKVIVSSIICNGTTQNTLEERGCFSGGRESDQAEKEDEGLRGGGVQMQ
jgi:hypothetical protein